MPQLRINPETHQLEGPGVTATMGRAQIEALAPPDCPVCGTPVTVDRIDVTWNAEEEAMFGRSYILGRWECPRGCDPVKGVRHHFGQSFERHPAVDGTVCKCSCGDETVVMNVAEAVAWQDEHRPEGTPPLVFEVDG